MAFSVTYHSLATNNIKNLYGGLPQEIKWRILTNPTAMNTAQRNHERQRTPAPVEKFLDERYYEYDEQNEIRVPRAPAFRLLSRSRVDDIVNRLSQPTVSKRRRASDLCHRELKRSMNENCEKCRAVSARSVVSRQKVAEITGRVSAPTVSANVRNSMRCLSTMSIQDIHQSCDKCAWQPSRRFTREFSNLI